MRLHTCSCLLMASAILLSSCGPASPPDTSAADAAAIKAADEKWSAAASRKDVDATVAFYADDAVVLPANAPIVTDRKTIRETWAGMLIPNASISWKVTKAEAARSGDIGYIYGTYLLTMPNPKGGPAISDTGKMVEVWKKQANGEWKCIVDTFNSDLPLAPAAPEKK